MSNPFVDAINAVSATLPAVAAPAAPADSEFGSDLSCTDDLTPTMDEVAADSPLAVAQADHRRLVTDRSTFIDDPDYGWNLEQLLHKGMTPAELAGIPGQIRAELLKDDRHETLDVWLTGQNTTNLVVHIQGTTADGPFGLTFALTDAGVALREIYG